MLTAFSPALILFGVTSVDYTFAALATAVAWLLVSHARGAPGGRVRPDRRRLVMLGLPTSWIALRAVARGDPAAESLALVIAAALPIRRLQPVLLALVAQALVIELLFNTVW